MQDDGETLGNPDYEARARLLFMLAGQASDASIAAAQRQLASGYALLARWRQRYRPGAVGTRTDRDPARA